MRTLPISPVVPMMARMLYCLLRGGLALLAALVVGYAFGFRLTGGFVYSAAFVILVLAFTLALSLAAALPALTTLFVAVLLLGTSFTCYQVAITNLVGALGEPKERTRNYSVLSLGFAGASFLGPLIAGFAIDGLGHKNSHKIVRIEFGAHPGPFPPGG